jgi:hypothetical protein
VRYWIAPALLFLVSGFTLALLNFNYSNPAAAASDQNAHHLPAIISYTDRYSPNIPGYYVLFGAVRRWVTSSTPGLRAVNFLMTAGLVATLAWAVAPGCPPVAAVLLVTPFMFSNPVFSRGVWLATDNPAWWGVLVVLLLALREAVRGGWHASPCSARSACGKTRPG